MALAYQRHFSSSDSQLYSFFFTIEQFLPGNSLKAVHPEVSWQAVDVTSSLAQLLPQAGNVFILRGFPRVRGVSTLPECQLDSGYGGPQPPFHLPCLLFYLLGPEADAPQQDRVPLTVPL